MSVPARRRALVVPFSLVLVLLVAALGPAVVRAADSPGPGDDDPALYDPVLAAERDEVQDETAGRLSRYRIDATLIPGDPARIEGTVDLLYYNDTGRTLEALYLRLYANDDLYEDGGMTLEAVEVDDLPVTPALSVEDTVAELPLPTELAEEETVPLAVTFTAEIPGNPSGGYGMYGVDDESGTWALAHWYPVLAGHDQDGEWNLLPPSVNGDPVFTNAALYEVTLTAPDRLVLVTSGSEVETDAAGDALTSHRFLTGPVRDFTIVADDDFQVLSQEVDGTTVNSWYNPDQEAGAASVLDDGVEAVRIYSDRFGPYPYEELDLVDVDVGGGAAGIEFPQLVFIGDDYYDAPATIYGVPGYLEMLVVHEVAHQWWYGLVGNDQYVDAFIDEGLASYSEAIYFEARYGPEVGQATLDFYLKANYLAWLFERGDGVVHQPTDSYPDPNVYSVFNYYKASLGFDAIHDAIGDDAFFAALPAYVAEFRFGIATPADLLAAFEEASGQDLDELWRHWFEAAEGAQDYTPEDLNDLLRQFGE